MTPPNIATLGLQLNTSGLKSGVSQTVQQFSAIKQAAEGITGGLTSLQSAIAQVAVAFGALKLGSMAQELLNIGARYETLGVVLKTVGVNAGYTDRYLGQLQHSLEKTGISMVAARQVITQFIQSQLSLTQATKLARVAQDAAVVANQNSSDTLLQIVHAIQSGQSRILANIGLNLSWAKSYEDLARTLHITVEQLSMEEKVQARVNAVMTAGAGIAGAYESAMTTAGKQVLSMQRYVENLKVQVAQAFLPIYTAAVFAWANALKNANEHLAVLQGMLVAGTLITGIIALSLAFKALAVSIALVNIPLAIVVGTLAFFVGLGVAAHQKIKAEAEAAKKALDEVTTSMYGEATAAQTLANAIKDMDANRTKTNMIDNGSVMLGETPGADLIDETAHKKAVVNLEVERLGILQQRAVAEGRIRDAEKLAFQQHMYEFAQQTEANQNLYGFEKDRAIAMERQRYALEQITEQLQKNLALQREIARHGNTGNLVPFQQAGTGYGSGGPTIDLTGPGPMGTGNSFVPAKDEWVFIPGLGWTKIPHPGGFRDATGRDTTVPQNPRSQGLPELTSYTDRPGARYSYGNEVAAGQVANGPNYNAVPGTGSGIMQGSRSSGLREEADAVRIDKQRALAEQFTAVWLNAVEQIQIGIGNTFQKILNGQITTLRGFATEFLTMIRNIFSQLAAAYATSLVAKLIGGPLVSAASSMGGTPLQKGNLTAQMAAPVHHRGGVVGELTNVRYVDPSVFTHAQRYHQGGIAGLKPNEVAAILERGERVIPKNKAKAHRGLADYQEGILIPERDERRDRKVAAEQHHKGGLAGGIGNARYVDPEVFTNAYRYHRGGVAGLKPGEIPAILERGERVMPKGHRGENVIQVTQNVNQHLHAVDGESMARLLVSHGHVIAGVVAQAAQDIPGYAGMLRGPG